MVTTFGLLAGAVLALWLGGERRWGWLPAWAWLASAALGMGLASGVVRPVALIGIAGWVLAVMLWARTERREERRGLRIVAVTGVIVVAAALMLHRVPGFANPRVVSGVRFTPDALPFALYLNFDKTVVGLLLFGWALPRIVSLREWREVLAKTAPRAAAVIGVLMGASLASGYVRWAPKLPAEAPVWAAVNLLSTCLAEEALFRGFVQGGLRRAWGKVRGGKWLALAVAAVLFGLVHAGGGASYVTLATLAGAGYGWVYEKTQRVEASVLTHFALNALHFFFFTYPALATRGGA